MAGDAIYILGPVAGGGAAPVQVGALSHFACQVQPDSCTDTAPTDADDCDDLTLTKVSSYSALRRHVVSGMSFDVLARRVIGSFANRLASDAPGLAHAVVQAGRDRGHAVSLRALLDAPSGADALCRLFGGGGRAGAAGIDHLPAAQLPRFMAELAAARWGG